MAALRVPFQAKNYLKLAEAITNDEIEPIRQEYSQDLFNVIKLMTDKKPRNRPTARQLLTIPKIVQSLLKST
jgi:serine/threonine protein kinase